MAFSRKNGRERDEGKTCMQHSGGFVGGAGRSAGALVAQNRRCRPALCKASARTKARLKKRKKKRRAPASQDHTQDTNKVTEREKEKEESLPSNRDSHAKAQKSQTPRQASGIARATNIRARTRRRQRNGEPPVG